MAIISVSRQVGSFGDEIAAAVAEKLGYSLVEKSQISQTLSKQGFPETEIDKYDERKPSVWQSLSRQKQIYAHLIRAAVYELVEGGDVVIVGRGSQVILRNIPGTLHVRVIAPLRVRVRRLTEQAGCEETYAEQIIRKNDRDSSGYISTYFDADWNDGNLYDLIINTRTMTTETGASLIVDAVGTEAFQKDPRVHEQLHDLGLAKKGEVALLPINGAERVSLEVRKGIAYLAGTAASATAQKECERALGEIDGITRVESRLHVLPENMSVF